jgi:virginiamycin B lyase
MTTGPDNNVWVPEFDVGKIAQITEAGTVSEFPIPTAGAQPDWIAPGPDGNLWFTEFNHNTIGRVTPSGAVTEFPLTAPLATAPPDSTGFEAQGIAAGPDGNLWFAHAGANVIGVMSVSGAILHVYPIPTANSDPMFATRGPDNNIWFAETNSNQIGRITMSGTVTEFPIPTANAGPRNLVVGSDNNLWFPELEAGNVARITPAGVITEFPMVADPTVHRIRRIAATPDGSIWFVMAMIAAPWDSEIGKMSVSGAEEDLWAFPLGAPRAITAGPDGSPWFADETTENVVRL